MSSATAGRKAPATISAVRAPQAEDEDGGKNAADSDRPQQDALKHAEDPSEHLVGNGALEERERGDIHDGVGDPDDAEHEQSEPLIRPDADQDQR